MVDAQPPPPPSQVPQSQVPQPPGAPAPSGNIPRGPRATFWIRFVAALADGLLLGLVFNVVIAAILGRGAGQTLGFVFGIAYYIYLEGSPSGQTIGKKLMNIRVISFSTGGRAGYGAATIRYFARWLSALPLLLGYFWMLWDDEKQTWHDKLSTTVVVPTSAYPVENWPG